MCLSLIWDTEKWVSIGPWTSSTSYQQEKSQHLPGNLQPRWKAWEPDANRWDRHPWRTPRAREIHVHVGFLLTQTEAELEVTKSVIQDIQSCRKARRQKSPIKISYALDKWIFQRKKRKVIDPCLFQEVGSQKQELRSPSEIYLWLRKMVHGWCKNPES